MQSSGCRVQGAGCRVQGSGFRGRVQTRPEERDAEGSFAIGARCALPCVEFGVGVQGGASGAELVARFGSLAPKSRL